MKEIVLQGGQYVALVDDADYERLSTYIWRARVGPTGTVYEVHTNVRGSDGRYSCVSMPRMILGVTDPRVTVKRRDFDTLNNQRANLREVDSADVPQNNGRPPQDSAGLADKQNAWKLRKKDLVKYSSLAAIWPNKRELDLLHGIWNAMIHRCNNPKAQAYHNYGGRGIAVCARWERSFLAFLNDMWVRPEPAHLYSLDRINNDGDYEPDNCRWATAKQQNSNQRIVC